MEAGGDRRVKGGDAKRPAGGKRRSDISGGKGCRNGGCGGMP